MPHCFKRAARLDSTMYLRIEYYIALLLAGRNNVFPICAAFFSSPTFKFQRIHYRKFPLDTIASYFVQYKKAMKDPACVVLVAEDVIDEHESEHVYDAIRESFKSVALRRRGIVGVCSIQLKPESAYTHQFQPPEMLANLNERLSAHDLERDQSIEAANIYDAVTRPTKLKYAWAIHLNGDC
jgi:hypothetical protein